MICQQHTSSTVTQGHENYSTTITGDHVNGLVHRLMYKDQCTAVTTLNPSSNSTCSRYDHMHCYTNSVSQKRMYDAGENRVTVKPLSTFFPTSNVCFFLGSEKSPFCILFYLNTDINITLIVYYFCRPKCTM